MGLILTVAALGGLFLGVRFLRDHDYIAASLLLLAGLAVLRAGVDLLRLTVGE